VLAVRHAILPTTARLKPDSAKLLAAAQPAACDPRWRVLAPVDMVQHSATHLFCNEDVGNGLRDLADLDSLLREFVQESGFCPWLTARAAELDLARPLYYALRYVVPILDTPLPAGLRRGMMDAIFLHHAASGPSRGERRSRLPRARFALCTRALAAHITAAAGTPFADQSVPARAPNGTLIPAGRACAV
jgi:hypothetical protein